jgi:tetratricopeptide (TPR) repeat protein
MAHFGLGMALRDNDRRRAEAELRKSLEIDDRFAMAHNYLGYVLDSPANRDERIRCYQRAIELDPTFAFPHYNLALVLRAKGDVPGAIAEFENALKLFPKHTFSHLELGRTLAGKKDWRAAADHLRQVVEINPLFSEAYALLGHALLEAGDAAGAANVYRLCVQRFPAWPLGYERLVYALIQKGDHTEAIRVYNLALLRADRTWPEATRRQMRYNAACAAVRAATGDGQDPPPPADRAVFRQQALAWLRTELDSHRKNNESKSAAARTSTATAMRDWLADPDFASVRDAAAIAKLSPTERDAWNQLWADVRRLQEAATQASGATK